MSLCDCAQPRRVFARWHYGSTTLDLNKNHLQAVAASQDARGRAMIFANRQQIADTNIQFASNDVLADHCAPSFAGKLPGSRPNTSGRHLSGRERCPK
jgi:hypothetical protein